MELEVGWSGQNPRTVGRIHQNERGRIHFEYDPAWRSGTLELSPFHLPNSTTGAVTTPTPGFGELHGLFQDALPDWWGERLMRRCFEKAGIPWNRVTALRKLSCQGDRKMGALSFLPTMAEADFNVLAANDDDHGRNHAFLMDEEGNWTPAPAYDLTLATNPLGSGFRAARVNGRSMDVTTKDLIRLGLEHDVRSPAQIIQQVRDAIATWPAHAERYAIHRANIAHAAAQHRISS